MICFSPTTFSLYGYFAFVPAVQAYQQPELRKSNPCSLHPGSRISSS